MDPQMMEYVTQMQAINAQTEKSPALKAIEVQMISGFMQEHGGRGGVVAEQEAMFQCLLVQHESKWKGIGLKASANGR